MESGTDWLCEILQNVQLEQFYLPIRDQLQITRLAHFDYVHAEDLERIGISKPGIRRLLDAVKKKKLQLWNRKFWNKLFGSSSNASKEKTDTSVRTTPNEARTTCIILEKDIVLHNELGSGSFGVVRRGEWKISEQSSQQVAVKVLKADAFTQPGVYDDFRQEVEAMHSLKHANLIRLHGVVFHPLMMVCELAPMGALLDYIRAQNGKLSLHYVSKWAEQVAAGMAHLEKNRFLHRDLACRNILLSTVDLIKIGDFGLMRPLSGDDDCYVMNGRRRVPFPWCAPESLHRRQFSHASDVWMFAVALWEMYTFGEEPWMGLNGSEILRLIMREGQRLAAPAACPPDAYMLMMQCWDINPKERPTFAGIHKYMSTFKFETAISALSYRKQGQMSIEAGDAIILIDKRPELHWWKGQNQRSLEVGLFPSTLVVTSKNKAVQQAVKKSQTLSPGRKAAQLSSASLTNGASDDSAVVLRKRRTSRTIESSQPVSTRGGNTGNKHFNYNKLVNDRALSLHADAFSANTTGSRTQVREDLLIDLYMPPSIKSPSKSSASHNNVSILDEPIDVPELGQEQNWGEQSLESLPSYSSVQQNRLKENLFGAKSLDNLLLNSPSSSQMTVPQPDPFDTSQIWPVDTQPARSSVTPRPNYDIQVNNIPPTQTNNESQIYSSNRYAPSTSNDTTIYNNMAAVSRSNSTISNTPYGTVPKYSYTNASGQSVDRNVTNEPNITNSLADMSLDDRISASLNLKSKNTNSENIYANNTFSEGPSSSSVNTNNDRYKDIPIYSNFEINPSQQQFILETKDYYTKLSTPAGARSQNNYEKNIYVPKQEELGEKLQNFSESMENSKNYSALKYQNVDYSQYGYGSSFGSSTWSIATYDAVNDADSNLYSEIGEESSTSSQPSQPIYTNNQGAYSQGPYSRYDEVYEAPTPRPHRPAPPAPKPK